MKQLLSGKVQREYNQHISQPDLFRSRRLRIPNTNTIITLFSSLAGIENEVRGHPQTGALKIQKVERR